MAADKSAFNLPIEWRTHWYKAPFRLVDAATANWSTRRDLLKYTALPLAVAMFLGANLSYLYFASGATSWLIAAIGTAVPSTMAAIGHLAACWRFSEAKAWRRGEEIKWLSAQLAEVEKNRTELQSQIDSIKDKLKTYEKVLELGTQDGQVEMVDLAEVLRIKTDAIDGLYKELRKLKQKLDDRDLEIGRIHVRLDAFQENQRDFIPLRPLGEGGMGSIFKVYDKSRKQVAVLKFIKHDQWNNKEVLQRFAIEAEVLQNAPTGHFVQYIAHGNLERRAYAEITKVALLEEELAGEPVPYLEMEYITDPTLEDVMSIERRLDPEKVLNIGVYLAEGLISLLKQNVAHRDIKPANIFIDTATWLARLGDLGIAKKEDVKTTKTGYIMGSIIYAAPEVLLGRCKNGRGWEIADQHSLGVVLYEMLTGELPRGEGIDQQVTLLQEIISTDPPEEIKVPGVNKNLAAVVLKLIASDPEARYPSMQAAYDALNGITL